MTTIKRKIVALTLYLILLAAAGIFCLFSEPLQKSASETLYICATSVIPSLFPFMVISSLLTWSAPRLFEKNSSHEFLGLPHCSVIAMFLGALCGSPVGIVTVAGLKHRGLLTKSQAQRLAAVSNNTGPAFVIEVIGASFLRSRQIGVCLYLIQLLSCLLLGSVFLIITKGENDSEFTLPRITSDKLDSGQIASMFTKAVGSASSGVVRVCGYIVFFSVINKGISLLFPYLGKITLAVISCVLEFTTGCKNASEIGGKFAVCACSFAISFSGISVMSQSSAFAFPEDISLKKTFVFKLIQGICSAVLAYFII